MSTDNFLFQLPEGFKFDVEVVKAGITDKSDFIDAGKYIVATSTNSQAVISPISYPSTRDILILLNKLQKHFNKNGILGIYDGVHNLYCFYTGSWSALKSAKYFSYDEAKLVLAGAKDPNEEEKRLLEYFWGTAPTSDKPHMTAPKGTLSPEHCAHNWQIYNGFNEDYHFCTKCDTKRPLDNQ